MSLSIKAEIRKCARIRTLSHNARQMAILVWHYFTVKKLVSFRYPFPAVMSYWMSL